MANANCPLFEINLLYFPGKEVHTPEHFADRIHDCRKIHIAGRDFLKHGREQEEVLTIYERDFDRGITSKFPFQFHGHSEPGKTAAENQYSLSVFHDPFLQPFCSWARFDSYEDFGFRLMPA
jgi:hypothetical protein